MSNEQDLPLKGIVVLEASMILAGPFIGTQLAEFGAEVIKIEKPGVGDPLRNMGTMDDGEPLWFASTGRNKKSVALDLNLPEGQEIFKEMTKGADVVTESFRPGTFDKWGLDYQALSAINPRLIMVRISGYGQTGPYRHRAGFGRTCQAFAGLTNLTGFPDRPPISTPYPSGDYSTALIGAFATMTALYYRDARNGLGQEIDLAIYESVFRQLEFLVPEYHKKGVVRQRKEPRSSMTGPTGVWQSRDKKWVAITITTNKVFKRMCRVIGRPELAEDERYNDQRKRKIHEIELTNILSDWVGTMDGDEVSKILNQNDVPTSVCMSIDEIFTDEHYKDRQMLSEIPHPRLGSLMVSGIVPKFSRTPGKIERLGPSLGEHTDEVLSRMIGYSEKELEILRKKKIIQ